MVGNDKNRSLQLKGETTEQSDTKTRWKDDYGQRQTTYQNLLMETKSNRQQTKSNGKAGQHLEPSMRPCKHFQRLLAVLVDFNRPSPPLLRYTPVLPLATLVRPPPLEVDPVIATKFAAIQRK